MCACKLASCWNALHHVVMLMCNSVMVCRYVNDIPDKNIIPDRRTHVLHATTTPPTTVSDP